MLCDISSERFKWIPGYFEARPTVCPQCGREGAETYLGQVYEGLPEADRLDGAWTNLLELIDALTMAEVDPALVELLTPFQQAYRRQYGREIWVMECPDCGCVRYAEDGQVRSVSPGYGAMVLIDGDYPEVRPFSKPPTAQESVESHFFFLKLKHSDTASYFRQTRWNEQTKAVEVVEEWRKTDECRVRARRKRD